jgi:O-antigen ligase
MSPRAGANVTKATLAAAAIGAVVLMSPMGESVIDHLPFIGTVEAENITYRQRLFEVSTLIVMQNPFFGSFDYLYRPEMQELVMGGMIDVVNSYIGVALSSGLVGLALFSGAFICAALALWKGRRHAIYADDEMRVLGSALLATLVGIMLIIFTVSSITIVPLVYWTFIGICLGYFAAMREAAHETADDPQQFAAAARASFAPPTRARAS